MGIAFLGAGFAFGVEVGLGAGAQVDLPDAITSEYARFGPGPEVVVPVRVDVGPAARVVAQLRGDLATGTDLLVWQHGDGEDRVVVHDEALPARLVAGALLLGAEIRAPWEGVRPYAGAAVGLSVASVLHSDVGSDGRALIAALGGGTVQPRTLQWVPVSDVHVGADVPLSGGLDLWAETGYSVAFLRSAPLREVPPTVTASRQSIGWNALRLVVGVTVATGGGP